MMMTSVGVPRESSSSPIVGKSLSTPCSSSYHIATRLTFNEPWCTAVLGYGNGEHAPGLKSEDASAVYMAGHNLLRAHAYAVDIYRKKFQQAQGGKIGITLNANWVGKSRHYGGRRKQDHILVSSYESFDQVSNFAWPLLSTTNCVPVQMLECLLDVIPLCSSVTPHLQPVHRHRLLLILRAECRASADGCD